MKKIYLVIILAAFASFTFAQKTTTGSIGMSKPVFMNSKTPTDTIYPESCLSGTPSLYNSTGGGYVCGTNSYADLAKAQAFILTASSIVEGCLFWVGAKAIIGTPGTLNVKLYKMDGTGTLTGGSGPCPGTVLATATLSMSVVDTGLSLTNGLNAVSFSSPVNVPIDFALGLDFSSIGNDTIGIVSTTDGDALQTELTFDKWSDNSWHSLLEPNNWGLDFDMYIFAVIDNSSAGIESDNYFDGIKLSQNQPNPVSTTTLIQYALENNGNVTLEIYDMTGKLVLTYDEGQQIAGNHSIVIDSEQLSKGTYYYSLKADKHRLTKKMVITE